MHKYKWQKKPPKFWLFRTKKTIVPLDKFSTKAAKSKLEFLIRSFTSIVAALKSLESTYYCINTIVSYQLIKDSKVSFSNVNQRY